MQQTYVNSMLQESLKRLDVLQSCTELPSYVKVSLDSIKVADDVEDLLKTKIILKLW